MCGPPGPIPDGEYTGPDYLTETARNYRYRLEVLSPLGDVLLYAHKCARPSIEFDVITVHNGQDEIYRPGKHRWKPIDVTFYEVCKTSDGISSDLTARLIYNWWAVVTAEIARSRINAPSRSFLKNIDLSMLDGKGKSIWRYHMLDCWPSNISPSELAYADTNIADITLTIHMAKCREVDPSGFGSGGASGIISTGASGVTTSGVTGGSSGSSSGSNFGGDILNNNAFNQGNTRLTPNQ